MKSLNDFNKNEKKKKSKPIMINKDKGRGLGKNILVLGLRTRTRMCISWLTSEQECLRGWGLPADEEGLASILVQ